MPDHGSHQGGASKESLLDRAIDKFKPQPAPPPKPAAPSAKGNRAWEDSVEQHHVVPGLTVRDVGLSVFGETRSFRDRPGSNESIHVAREKVAHAIINGRELALHTGKKPPSVHPPDEPPASALRNPEVHAAYDSSLRAAREAYLSGHDPTNGAIYLNTRPTPDRSIRDGRYAMSTQSGPYNNSFVRGDQKSHTVWLNTYYPDQQDKRTRASKRE